MFSSSLSFSSPFPASIMKGSQQSSRNPKKSVASLCKESNANSCSGFSNLLHKSVPLAVSVCILLWSNPGNAGILSGSPGLESVPGPQLPQFDFLSKWNAENQKKYAEFDSRFKSSQVLKELLEKSKANKERNKTAIQDKYCLRGAEWGVGDCSTQGMTDEERDAFIAMLKKKTGEK